MKIKAILKLLKEDGWEQVAQKGSHKQFKHPSKKGRVTVPDHVKTLISQEEQKTPS